MKIKLYMKNGLNNFFHFLAHTWIFITVYKRFMNEMITIEGKEIPSSAAVVKNDIIAMKLITK